jgi:hypothetical protein
VAGLDPTRPDSDNDGIADKLEMQSGAAPADDPLSPDPYDSPVT